MLNKMMKVLGLKVGRSQPSDMSGAISMEEPKKHQTIEASKKNKKKEELKNKKKEEPKMSKMKDKKMKNKKREALTKNKKMKDKKMKNKKREALTKNEKNDEIDEGVPLQAWIGIMVTTVIVMYLIGQEMVNGLQAALEWLGNDTLCEWSKASDPRFDRLAEWIAKVANCIVGLASKPTVWKSWSAGAVVTQVWKMGNLWLWPAATRAARRLRRPCRRAPRGRRAGTGRGSGPSRPRGRRVGSWGGSRAARRRTAIATAASRSR